MVLMAVRIFVDIEKWTIRRNHPTDRDVAFRFFQQVLGQREGNAALFRIEKRIAEAFGKEEAFLDVYDLTAYLSGFGSVKTEYAEESKEEIKLEEKSLKGLMSFARSAAKKGMDNMEKAKNSNQKPEPKIEFSSEKVLEEFRQSKEPWMLDDRNFEQFGYKQDIIDIEDIQRKAVAFSQHIIKKWQEDNPGKIEKGQAAPICELHKLWKSVLEKDSSTNTVIAISGFMSKNSDKSEEWKEFTDYFVKQKLFSNTYALNWEAKNPDEIWEEKGKDMAVSAITGGLALLAAAKVSKL